MRLSGTLEKSKVPIFLERRLTMLYTEPNHKTDVANGKAPSKPNLEKTEPVIKGKVHVPKKSFGDQLIDTFVLGNADDIKDYLINTVAIPTIKTSILNAVAMALNMPLPGVTPPNRNAGSYGDPKITDYRSSYSKPSGQVRSAYTGNDYRSHTYTDMWFDSASDAEAVIEHLRRVLAQYRFVSIAEVYMACDERTTPTDFEWGWYDVSDMYVYRKGTNQFGIHFPPIRSR